MSTEEQISRLRELANQAREYQIERDWSDSRICKEIAQLGSTKTYKRILNPEDPLDELNVSSQVESYESAIELIGILRGKDTVPEPEYDDFRNIVAVRRAVTMAVQEEGNQRFICVEGENGCGKDAALKAIIKRWPKLVVPVEADECWRDSISVPLGDMITALGVKRHNEEGGDSSKLPHLPVLRREMLIEELSNRRVVLAINEFHQIGVRGLSIPKTIINKTRTIIVGFCIPVLLTRLMKSGYEEVIQLFGNRLCLRVRLETPSADEILLLFQRRGVKFENTFTANEFSKASEKEAPMYGNWSFVKRVCRKAIRVGQGKAIGASSLSDCLADAKRDCISHRKLGQ